MKIVFVNRFFHPDTSATSQMLSDLALHLAAAHTVHVVTSRLRYDEPGGWLEPSGSVGGAAVHRVWTSRFGRASLFGRTVDYLTFYVSASLRLLSLVHRGDVVVALTDPPLLSVPVALVVRLRRARLVNWLHDLFPEIAGELDFKWMPRWMARTLAGCRDWSLREAAANVVLGDRMAQKVAGSRVATAQVRVIHNWAPGHVIRPLPPAENPLRREWGLDGKYVVGYSGNMGRAHDLAALLDAAQRLAARPEIVFLLIGGGKQRAALEADVRARRLGNVMFQAYQPREQLGQSLTVPDCHVVSLKPSLEGLIVPSKLYSSMASGRPVLFLGAADGEIGRLMQANPGFGVQVSPDDAAGVAAAITGLSGAPAESAASGRRGRAIFERLFDQPVALSLWSDLVAEVAARRPVRRHAAASHERAGMPSSSQRRLSGYAHIALIALLAWGAFSFGAVYPWAYWLLAAAATLVGLAGLFVDRRPAAGASPALVVSLLLFACAVLLQLLPLPGEVLQWLSPEAPGLIARFELAIPGAAPESHPTSIHPPLTRTGLALFGAFSLLLIGTSRLLSVRGVRTTVNAITVMGVCLALAGIIQKPLYTGAIYGFWVPESGRDPFGPFVNRNHFAGWMLLALPLTLGLAGARMDGGMRNVKPTWRARVLWLASAEATELMLLLAASVIMAVSLALTMSRSGMIALAAALTLTAAFVVQGHATRARKWGAVLALLLLIVLSVTSVGAGRIVNRFSETGWTQLDARRGAAADAWRIASAFPLVGTGVNTYGVATLFYQRHEPEKHYAQAHNDYLQLAAEGGLLLTIPAGVCLALLVRDIRRRMLQDQGVPSYWIRAGAVVALVAIALQETVEFSLQMPGNAAMFAVVCGIALHKRPERRRSGRLAVDTSREQREVQSDEARA